MSHFSNLGALVLLFLSLPVSLSAQTDRTRNGLAIRGTAVSTKCLAWNKNLAEVRLRLQLTNTLRQSLILKKTDLEIETVKYFALIDEARDNVHLGEFAIERLRGYLPEYDQEIDRARPNDQFVILRPRQTYVFETTESIPLIPAAPDKAATKPADEYQIELEVGTWVNHARPLAESLRRRWARLGVLWTQTVWSEPVKFVFPRKRTCEQAKSAQTSASDIAKTLSEVNCHDDPMCFIRAARSFADRGEQLVFLNRRAKYRCGRRSKLLTDAHNAQKRPAL